MYILPFCIAALTLGINAGWERQPDGSLEYIIQLDRQTFDALGRGGLPIGGDFPPEIKKNLASYRIEVGNRLLPKDAPPQTPPKTQLPPKTPPPIEEKQPQEQRPWLPLTFAILVLTASLAGNAYLGWIAWDSRRGYREMALRLNSRENPDQRP